MKTIKFFKLVAEMLYIYSTRDELEPATAIKYLQALVNEQNESE